MSPFLIWILVIFSLAMSVQAAHTLYLMLYTWDRSDTYEAARAPRKWRAPRLSFTVLLPARHEEEVIGRTIERVLRANYPRHLVEAIVICEAQDTGTIAAARAAIDALAAQGFPDARVITFDDGPINKPHGLNKGLAQARHDVVTIFDAEDEIHPDIFHVVNTIMLNEGVRVVQSGVQLMNYNSTWFSAHNVLEYYFWFKSRLHVHAKNGMTPLGGNTVFFATDLIREIGGWDEKNLTEDADIGIRLSVRGERIRVVYDDAYVTQEETPPDLQSFVKQRTRWNQGFLQTLKKGEWRKVPRLSNRLTALYILAFPFLQALLALYVPFSLAMILTVKLPVLFTFPLLLPSYLLVAHYLLSVVGVHEFARTHNLRLPRPWIRVAFRLLATYFPYQWALGYASVNAVWRELRGINNWEKTAHVGAHREIATYEASVGVGLAGGPTPTEISSVVPAEVMAQVLAPAPVLPVARRSGTLRRTGIGSMLILGLAACATALGPLSPLTSRVGQALPLSSLVRLTPLQGSWIGFGPLLSAHASASPSIGSRRTHSSPASVIRFGVAPRSVLAARYVNALPSSRTTPSQEIPRGGANGSRVALLSLRVPARSLSTFYRRYAKRPAPSRPGRPVQRLSAARRPALHRIASSHPTTIVIAVAPLPAAMPRSAPVVSRPAPEAPAQVAAAALPAARAPVHVVRQQPRLAPAALPPAAVLPPAAAPPAVMPPRHHHVPPSASQPAPPAVHPPAPSSLPPAGPPAGHGKAGSPPGQGDRGGQGNQGGEGNLGTGPGSPAGGPPGNASGNHGNPGNRGPGYGNPGGGPPGNPGGGPPGNHGGQSPGNPGNGHPGNPGLGPGNPGNLEPGSGNNEGGPRGSHH